MRHYALITIALITLLLSGCAKKQKPVAGVLFHPQATPDTLTIEINPTGKVRHMKVNTLDRSLRTFFCDSNAVQLMSATKIGVQPITDLKSAYNLCAPIQRVYSCDAYYIDSLDHSMPYLVPRAARLLYDIGKAFNDSLLARSGGHYRLKVTSIMRTEQSVTQLRKHNRNASSQSCHRFGTTFDISYYKFVCYDKSVILDCWEMKCILVEILKKFREDGRCFVKYEEKQACFHITAR
jgi:hypothetical protein